MIGEKGRFIETHCGWDIYVQAIHAHRMYGETETEYCLVAIDDTVLHGGDNAITDSSWISVERALSSIKEKIERKINE